MKVLAFVANGISASMARAAYLHDGYSSGDVGVVAGRRLSHGWLGELGRYIEFSKVPSLSPLGQIKTIGFYIRASRFIKKAILSGDLKELYITNTDNILSNHALRIAERRPDIRVTVLAEGNMNYQEIGLKNRAWWRWLAKPFAAALFGLKYRQPNSHLSGSFESRTDRVVAYSAIGLKAPAEKTLILGFERVGQRQAADDNTILILLTGLVQWMSAPDFEYFKMEFVKWVRGFGDKRILIKKHPNYDSGGVEDAIGNFEFFEDVRGVELLAEEVPAATVIGFCTTALVTLKTMRPDLRCIDFGSEFYCEKAYGGDRSIIGVLSSAGVELVNIQR